ncbi:MAG: hypothetical protein IIU11_01110 [Bacteroidales bacterium]|nr:hypothetical protein [Bacteroidales bacterium]
MTKTFIVLIFSVFFVMPLRAQQDPELEKIESVISCLSDNYLDTINMRRLVEETIKTMFERLDPHTVYRTKREAEEDAKKQSAFKRGLGIQFRMFNDSMTITYVIPESPAQKAGLKPGAKIAYIDREEVTGHLYSHADICEIIDRNKKDSVVLGIIKDKKIRPMTLFKGQVPNNSIESYYAPNDTTVYVRISRFSTSTGREFREVISKFQKRKSRINLILDLRDNPGGLLSPCIEVCDNFFDSDRQILSARGEHRDQSYFSTEKGLLHKSRVCVIINEKSASASEVVAGALQDWDRGVILGRRSFGKGLVQGIFTLSDSSQIRVTTAKYYTPSGRCIQKPYTPGKFSDYGKELSERKEKGENISLKNLKLDDAFVYQTIIKKRPVYSDMGIVPDIFIPEDTVKIADFWEDFAKNGVIDNFVMDDIDNRRAEYLKKYGTFQKFKSMFFIDSLLLESLYVYHVSDTTKMQKITGKDYDKSINSLARERICTNLKARYAFFLFGPNESRMILNSQDKEYNAALELINSPEEYYNVFDN